jgi:hypothetical protein
MNTAEASSPVYIYAQDFVSALIGPFDSKEAAYAHIVFCCGRGDGATMQVVDDPEELAKIKEEWAPMDVSVEEDLKFNPER